jgi:Phage integrase, N-terminal SAM-like domain
MPKLPSAPGFRDRLDYGAQPSEPPKKPKLLDQVRDTLRVNHYSLRTEEAYLQWIRRFILFNSKRHPADLGAAEIDRFLSHLAVEGEVSASTQNDSLVPLAHPWG